MIKPRISVVQYLNTAPLVWGMLHGAQRGKFRLEFTTPARCADAVARGQADVGIIPSIEVPRMEGTEVVPGISIASKRLVKSVLLISKVPIDRVRTVAMDNSSRTSAALVTVLLRRSYGLDFQSAPADPDLEQMLKRADAALLIGDPALTFQLEVESQKSKAQDVLVYDLAAEWKKLTARPFVFAVWAGLPEVGLGDFVHDFQESRDEGLRHLDAIASEWGPRLGLAESAVKLYLAENINYDLDEENLAGLRLFYKLAEEEGLIPAGKELRLVSQAAMAER